VEAIVDLAGANRAIDIIVEQGEGTTVAGEQSHYRSLQIQRELDAAVVADPDFAPAWPVADSPVMRQPPEPEGKVFVDGHAAAELLDFACATYDLLLRCLVQCFGRTGGEVEGEQTTLMSSAIELMHALGAAATALARLPASDAAPGVHAGMTFTMLRGVEPLLPGAVEQRLLQERIDALLGTRCSLSEHALQAIGRAAERIAALG
jgi:hypothetical protein